MRDAARLAEAARFIEATADRYDTVVGERGLALSGGQRRRIALARAILRDPAVLVLDEATSAADNETEAAIERSLAQVASDRTALIVARRLSTVRDADRIWVLAEGHVRRREPTTSWSTQVASTAASGRCRRGWRKPASATG